MDWLLGPALLSLHVGAWTVALHLVLGVGLATYLSGEKSFLKGVVDLLVSIPIVFPPIALGLFLLLLLGKNGWLGGALALWGVEVIFSFWGVLIASFVAGLPLVVKPIQSAIDEQSKRYAQASYTLGKGKLETLLRVILPNSKKVILIALFLGFGRSLGEVGITLMLGGNIIGKTDTLSLAIYNHAFGGDLEKAIILAIVLALVSAGIFLGLKKLAYM